MGHVNHAVYFTYLEQCRLTFWRELTGAPSPHTRVIIARAECDYRAPAHFGDELEVRLKVGEIGRSSFALEYEIVHVGERPPRRDRQDRDGQLRLRRRRSRCRCPTPRGRCSQQLKPGQSRTVGAGVRRGSVTDSNRGMGSDTGLTPLASRLRSPSDVPTGRHGDRCSTSSVSEIETSQIVRYASCRSFAVDPSPRYNECGVSQSDPAPSAWKR